MVWKLIGLSWRSVVENKWAFWGVVAANLVFALPCLWSVAPDQNAHVDMTHSFYDIMWSVDIIAVPFWTYVVLFGLKGEESIARIVRRCAAGAGYYIVYMLMVFVLSVSGIEFAAGVFPGKTGTILIVVVAWALMLLLGMYAAFRLQFLIPSKVAQDQMNLQEIWRLSKGWVLSSFLATFFVSIPSFLVFGGIALMDIKLFEATIFPIESACVNGLITPFTTGIYTHAYRAARAYAAQRESSIVPSESA